MTIEISETIVTSKYFSPNAITILCKRYFLRGDEYAACDWCGDVHENEDQFIERISLGNEEYRKELIEPGVFLANSPTLMNVGSKSGGTLSACFKFSVDDTMFNTENGIMPVAMKAAAVLKAGGGTGYALSKVRGEGTLVNSTHGKALGPLGVMRIYHTLAKEITQGGKRDAAQMAILRCDHPDIEKFIHCKDIDPDALGTFNISVALTDGFMNRATSDPDSDQARLLREMAESAWKTGDPGCYFIDTSNATNPTPWLGELDGTNPCGEVPLLPNEPCNLGSINLSKFYSTDLTQRVIDWPHLERVVELATRYLDDVLDLNTFPHPEIDYAARLTRKLGLGVCGFADLLTLMGVHYDSEVAVDIGEALMKRINSVAHRTSIALAAEKGVAPCFEGRNIIHRNATLTCIAPTGTIAILMGASSGIEPYFSLENTRTMGDGTVMIEKVNSEFIPHTANEIEAKWHIAHQAAFQKHTDLAVSKTINMAESVTPDDILEAYILMWKSGCKGGTVYRDKSRGNQVLKHSTDVQGDVSVETVETKHLSRRGWRETLPDERNSITHRFEIGGVKGYVQIGLFDDGAPGEMFLTLARAGSTLDGMADWLAHEISIELQMAHLQGVPFTVFTNKWIGRAFEPSGMTKNPNVPFTTSFADYLARWMDHRFGGELNGYHADTIIVDEQRGDLCPDCGSMLQFNEGCAHCVCGFEKC